MLALFLAALPGVLPAQQTQEPVYEEPPEEDEDLTRPTEYSFNPLQAAREFRVGEFYWKKKSYRAAAGRYEEATKWNPGLADAFFKLGETRLKLADAEVLAAEKELRLEAAEEAFRKYIEIEPDGKRARKAREKLARLEHRRPPSGSGLDSR